jgi:ABC-type Na+ efflux pump permease subunit
LALVVILLSFLLAVAALLHSYAHATPAERTSSGLNVLVFCIVLGLAPMVPMAVYLVAPDVVFPWSDYYDLTWVLIPFALARATVLQASRGPAGTEGG